MAKRIDTREEILRAASSLFFERGYGGTSTRDIAEAVGIRQPSLFHHFASKRAIMDELFASGLASVPFAERMAAADGSPAVRLYRYLRSDTAMLLASPYDLSGIFDSVLFLPEFERWREPYGRLLAAIERIIREGIAAGELRDVDVAFAVATIDGLNEVTIRSASPRGSARSLAGYPDLVATFALRGILADAAAIGRVRAAADEADLLAPAEA